MTDELAERVVKIEKIQAVDALRDKHFDEALTDIKDGIREMSSEIRKLKETRDQNSGFFRLINIAAAAVIAGIVSMLFGRLS